jgi:ABC-type dipeptide/oligopeptide/nickel transport system permease subunit
MYPIHFFVQGWEYKLFWRDPQQAPFGWRRRSIYLMGTDKLGRDSMANLMGADFLEYEHLWAVIALCRLCLWDPSGYLGGKADNIMQRFVEFVNAFPHFHCGWLAAFIPKTMDSLCVRIMACIFALLS